MTRCQACGHPSVSLACTSCGTLAENENGPSLGGGWAPHPYDPVSGICFEMHGKHLLPGDEVRVQLKNGRKATGYVDYASTSKTLYLCKEHTRRTWKRGVWVQFKAEDIASVDIVKLSEGEERPYALTLRSESPVIADWIKEAPERTPGPQHAHENNSRAVTFPFRKGLESKLFRLFEEPIGLGCPYLYRLEPDGILIADVTEETITLWKTNDPGRYLGFDPRENILDHLQKMGKSGVVLLGRKDLRSTVGSDSRSIFENEPTPASVRQRRGGTYRTGGKAGPARTVVRGFRFQVGGKKARGRQAKNKEKQAAAKRVGKRGLARRISAAKKWHRSSRGAAYHRALGDYNRESMKLRSQGLSKRLFENGLDYFFGDPVLWALDSRSQGVRTVAAGDLISGHLSSTPMGVGVNPLGPTGIPDMSTHGENLAYGENSALGEEEWKPSRLGVIKPGMRVVSRVGWVGTVLKVVETSSNPYAVVKWDKTGSTGRHTVTTLHPVEEDMSTHGENSALSASQIREGDSPELLRAIDDFASGITRKKPGGMYGEYIRALGIAMMRGGSGPDAKAWWRADPKGFDPNYASWLQGEIEKLFKQHGQPVKKFTPVSESEDRSGESAGPRSESVAEGSDVVSAVQAAMVPTRPKRMRNPRTGKMGTLRVPREPSFVEDFRPEFPENHEMQRKLAGHITKGASEWREEKAPRVRLPSGWSVKRWTYWRRDFPETPMRKESQALLIAYQGKPVFTLDFQGRSPHALGVVKGSKVERHYGVVQDSTTEFLEDLRDTIEDAGSVGEAVDSVTSFTPVSESVSEAVDYEDPKYEDLVSFLQSAGREALQYPKDKWSSVYFKNVKAHHVAEIDFPAFNAAKRGVRGITKDMYDHALAGAFENLQDEIEGASSFEWGDKEGFIGRDPKTQDYRMFPVDESVSESVNEAVGRDAFHIWHITGASNAKAIQSGGFKPMPTSKGPGVSVAVHPAAARGLLRTAQRMFSFRTFEDMKAWFVEMGADPDDPKWGRVGNEGDPARAYVSAMSLFHPAVGGSATKIPRNEFLWADIGKNLHRQGPPFVAVEVIGSDMDFDAYSGYEALFDKLADAYKRFSPKSIEAEVFLDGRDIGIMNEVWDELYVDINKTPEKIRESLSEGGWWNPKEMSTEELQKELADIERDYGRNLTMSGGAVDRRRGTMINKMREIKRELQSRGVRTESEVMDIGFLQAKDPYTVKYAWKRRGPIKVVTVDGKRAAEEFLASVKRDGGNGMIVKGVKESEGPRSESVVAEEKYGVYRVYVRYGKYGDKKPVPYYLAGTPSSIRELFADPETAEYDEDDNKLMPYKMAWERPARSEESAVTEAKEYVLWGLPKGSKDQIDAKVLLSNGRSMRDIEKVKKLAGRDGWHTFRVQVIDLSKPFDAGAAFAGAVGEAVKGMKNLTFLLNKPEAPIEMRGRSKKGYMAVFKEGKHYKVAHVPTGLVASPPFRLQADAAALAVQIEEELGSKLDFPADRKPTDVLKRIADIVIEYRMGKPFGYWESDEDGVAPLFEGLFESYKAGWMKLTPAEKKTMIEVVRAQYKTRRNVPSQPYRDDYAPMRRAFGVPAALEHSGEELPDHYYEAFRWAWQMVQRGADPDKSIPGKIVYEGLSESGVTVRYMGGERRRGRGGLRGRSMGRGPASYPFEFDRGMEDVVSELRTYLKGKRFKTDNVDSLTFLVGRKGATAAVAWLKDKGVPIDYDLQDMSGPGEAKPFESIQEALPRGFSVEVVQSRKNPDWIKVSVEGDFRGERVYGETQPFHIGISKPTRRLVGQITQAAFKRGEYGKGVPMGLQGKLEAAVLDALEKHAVERGISYAHLEGLAEATRRPKKPRGTKTKKFVMYFPTEQDAIDYARAFGFKPGETREEKLGWTVDVRRGGPAMRSDFIYTEPNPDFETFLRAWVGEHHGPAMADRVADDYLRIFAGAKKPTPFEERQAASMKKLYKDQYGKEPGRVKAPKGSAAAARFRLPRGVRVPGGMYAVGLAAGPNKDYHRGSWNAEVYIPLTFEVVSTTDAAVDAVHRFTGKNDLGGSNFFEPNRPNGTRAARNDRAGIVFDSGGMAVGRVTYGGTFIPADSPGFMREGLEEAGKGRAQVIRGIQAELTKIMKDFERGKYKSQYDDVDAVDVHLQVLNGKWKVWVGEVPASERRKGYWTSEDSWYSVSDGESANDLKVTAEEMFYDLVGRYSGKFEESAPIAEFEPRLKLPADPTDRPRTYKPNRSEKSVIRRTVRDALAVTYFDSVNQAVSTVGDAIGRLGYQFDEPLSGRQPKRPGETGRVALHLQRMTNDPYWPLDLTTGPVQFTFYVMPNGKVEAVGYYTEGAEERPNPVVEGINDPHIFKAVFLAGGPGSGKSFIANQMFKGTGLKFLNSDLAFEHLLTKRDLPFDINPDNEEVYAKQMQARGRAKELTKLRRQLWLDGMLGLVVDGTGKDYDKIAKMATNLKGLGYDTSMVFVNTSLDVAHQRNKDRKRSVPADVVNDSWRQVQSNMGKFQAFFGSKNFKIVDNSKPLDKQGIQELGVNLRRAAMKMTDGPIENPVGQAIVNTLHKTGGKTMSDIANAQTEAAARMHGYLGTFIAEFRGLDSAALRVLLAETTVDAEVREIMELRKDLAKAEAEGDETKVAGIRYALGMAEAALEVAQGEEGLEAEEELQDMGVTFYKEGRPSTVMGPYPTVSAAMLAADRVYPVEIGEPWGDTIDSRQRRETVDGYVETMPWVTAEVLSVEPGVVMYHEGSVGASLDRGLLEGLRTRVRPVADPFLLPEGVTAAQKAVVKDLRKFFKKKKIKVRYKSLATQGPWVEVRVDQGKDFKPWLSGAELKNFPDDIRSTAVQVLGGAPGQLSYGNAQGNMIAMFPERWWDFLTRMGEKVTPVAESVGVMDLSGVQSILKGAGGKIEHAAEKLAELWVNAAGAVALFMSYAQKAGVTVEVARKAAGVLSGMTEAEIEEAMPSWGYTGGTPVGVPRTRGRKTFPSERQIKIAAKQAGTSYEDAWVIARDYFAYAIPINQIIKTHPGMAPAEVTGVVAYLLTKFEQPTGHRREGLVHLSAAITEAWYDVEQRSISRWREATERIGNMLKSKQTVYAITAALDSAAEDAVKEAQTLRGAEKEAFLDLGARYIAIAQTLKASKPYADAMKELLQVEVALDFLEGMLTGEAKNAFEHLIKDGYDTDRFVPVVAVGEEVGQAGLGWTDGEATLWESYVVHRGILESKEYRDKDGVEYEQFSEGGDVYVFNRIFPGSIQIFTPLGEEIRPDTCGVCGSTPAGEMYHGPKLCADCHAVVSEKIKAEKEPREGLHTATAKKWCEEAGVGKRRKSGKDRIENMADILSKAKGKYAEAVSERSVVEVIARQVDKGRITAEVAERLLTEAELPTDVPRRILLPTEPVDHDFETAEAIEDWFEDCRETFRFDSREAMPHGVAYFGENEVVVVAYDHLLSEDARDAVIQAADAQRVWDGLIPVGDASTPFHSLLVREGEADLVRAQGFTTEHRTDLEKRRRVRFIQAGVENFVPGSVKTAYLSDGTEITFGTPTAEKDALLAKAWEEFDGTVSGKDPLEVEEGLFRHYTGAPSGLGEAADAALQKVTALDNATVSEAPALWARLQTEGTRVQSIIFPADKNEKEATEGASALGYTPVEVGKVERNVRVGVREPVVGAPTRALSFGEGITVILQGAQENTVRVYDDPYEPERLLREIALHNLVEGADKVAPMGPRSWALGYPDNSASLLVYFPRHGIARMFTREDLGIRFEGELSEQVTGMPVAPPETEAESMDQKLDSIVRKLVLNGSLDALQDVAFDDDTGSIYLFFSAAITREEAEDITQDLGNEYQQTRLVASPDQSLDGEVGESDWWVVFVPGEDETGAPGEPDPTRWGATKVPEQQPQGLSQFMDKDAVQSIAKGVSLDKAIDALTTESLAEVDFNPLSFALAFAAHHGLDETSLASSPLAPGTVFLTVKNEAGTMKRVDFSAPGVGDGVNVVVTDAANGQKETVGHFKNPTLTELLGKLGDNPAWKA